MVMISQQNKSQAPRMGCATNVQIIDMLQKKVPPSYLNAIFIEVYHKQK